MQLASNFSDEDMEVINAMPMHGDLGIPNVRLLTPGDPGRSLLLFRPALRGASQMPPVGSIKADPEGSSLLAQWIAGMTAAPEPSKAVSSAKP